MCQNIILVNATLDETQLRYMRRHEQELRRLVQKEILDADRVRILQKGGFLMSILTPLILRKAGPIIDRFTNKILSKI